MKKLMKCLMTGALIVVGAVLVSPSALAQVSVVKNDLYMGFQNQIGGGSSDYIINLGPASGIVGGSSVVTLSSDFSMTRFNAVIGISSSMYGGVAGASNAGNPSDIYATQLRTGGAGSPAVPGSTAPAGLTKAQDNSTFSKFATLNGPVAGMGTNDLAKSWENDVEPNFSGSFYGESGINPDSLVSTNAVLYEDLWESTNSAITGAQPFNYLGYFTLNLTGASPVLTFTPLNAPASLTAPVIESIAKASGTVTLVWTTVATHSYQLQYTTSLSPTNWINLGSAQLANGLLMTNTDSTFGTNATRFYQLMAQ